MDRATVERMYRDWSVEGIPKSVIEARYLRTRKHHGKLFNRLVRAVLDEETERVHPLRERVAELEREVARLSQIIQDHGLDTDAGGRNDESQLDLFTREVDGQ